MNLTELTTFLTVVEVKSLVGAAQRLNVTQSTVTARIDSLEERLGQRLLLRHKSGTELTSSGFKFLRYAEVMTQLWRQAQHEIGLPQGFTGVCNIGCYFDLWEGLVERFVAHLRSDVPEVAMAVWPGDQRSIDRWLETGLVDVAFCYSPEGREPFAIRALHEDRFERVDVPAPDPATAGEPSYVFIDYGEQFRRDHALAEADAPPSAVTLASARFALDHFRARGGSGYLSRRHMAMLPSLGRHRVRADAPVLCQTVFLIENRTVTRTWPWWEPAIARLVALLAEADA